MGMDIAKDQHERALKYAVDIAVALAGSDKSSSPGLIVEALKKSYDEIRRLDSEAGPPRAADSVPR